MSNITVNDVEEMAKSLADLRVDYESYKSVLSEKNKEIEELEAKIIGTLKELGKHNYKSEYGTITRVEKWRVNLPNTPEDRTQFFDFLKERGLFEQMISVNSNTLNSFWGQEKEAAIERDPEEALNFKLPGIGEPKLHETLSFRKK